MSSSRKKWIKTMLGTVLFFVCCFGITQYVTTVCIPFTAKADKIKKNLSSDDEDMSRTEVCLIGGSHGLNAFNPNAMWESEGLHSYNYCFAGETIPVTAIYLEELFKKRQFQVVVVDMYYIGLADPYFGEKNYSYDVLNKLPFSAGKCRYIREHVHEDVRKEYYFPLNRYHTRWLSLEEKDYERTPDPTDDWQLGQDFHFERNDGTTVRFEPWTACDRVIPLADHVEEELRELIDVVTSHGASLLLVDIPRRYDDAAPPAEWIGDERAAVNRVREIVAEYDSEGDGGESDRPGDGGESDGNAAETPVEKTNNGCLVEVLQFTGEQLDEIGFVPELHMFNKGHMNVEGSEVFSRALAAELVKRFDVTKHPRDPEDPWEKYCHMYHEKKSENWQG